VWTLTLAVSFLTVLTFRAFARAHPAPATLAVMVWLTADNETVTPASGIWVPACEVEADNLSAGLPAPVVAPAGLSGRLLIFMVLSKP